jgi:hypothetical protein
MEQRVGKHKEKEFNLKQDEKANLFSHLQEEDVPDLKETLKTRIMLAIMFIILSMSLILNNFSVILPSFQT